MAVNASLVALSKGYVFCTEPFLIPKAGTIDVACFDKTGTLTEPNLVIEGVVEENQLHRSPTKASMEMRISISTCHGLMYLDGEGIIGDPLEKSMNLANGTVLNKDGSISIQSSSVEIQIAYRFPFSSHLKRMAVVAQVKGFAGVKKDQVWISVKGAPEVLESRFSSKLTGYDAAYQQYAREGARVLALGYKLCRISTLYELAKKHFLAKNANAQWKFELSSLEKWVKYVPREEIETDLIFNGFLIFASALKKDTKSVIWEVKLKYGLIVRCTTH